MMTPDQMRDLLANKALLVNYREQHEQALATPPEQQNEPATLVQATLTAINALIDTIDQRLVAAGYQS